MRKSNVLEKELMKEIVRIRRKFKVDMAFIYIKTGIPGEMYAGAYAYKNKESEIAAETILKMFKGE